MASLVEGKSAVFLGLSIEVMLSITSFILGVGSTVWAMVQWYAKAQTKAYAAEREFNHLKRNQEQMSENLKTIIKEVDELKDDTRDVKRIFALLLSRQGESISGILGFNDDSKRL